MPCNHNKIHKCTMKRLSLQQKIMIDNLVNKKELNTKCSDCNIKITYNSKTEYFMVKFRFRKISRKSK